MAQIATTIEQSKKLKELGIDVNSADMHWQYIEEDNGQLQWFYFPKDFSINENESIPAWSLSALIGLMPYPILQNTLKDKWRCTIHHKNGLILKTGEDTDSPIDAAFEIVCYLLENKLVK